MEIKLTTRIRAGSSTKEGLGNVAESALLFFFSRRNKKIRGRIVRHVLGEEYQVKKGGGWRTGGLGRSCVCSVLHSVLLDPVAERGNSRVDAVLVRSASDAPADDAHLTVVHQQRPTTVTLSGSGEKRKINLL